MKTSETILIYSTDQRYSLYLKNSLSDRMGDFSVVALTDISEVRRSLNVNKISALIVEVDPDYPEAQRDLASLMIDHSAKPWVAVGDGDDDLNREKAFAMGASAFVHKAAEIDQLIERIIAFVNPGSEGGKLFSISPSAVLQIIQMEQRSCTIIAQSTVSKRSGSMYFSDGALMEARAGSRTGHDAALEILLWDEVDIQIHNYCPVEVKRIFESLEALLLYAEKLRDEQEADRVAAGKEIEAGAEFLIDEFEEDVEAPMDHYDRLCGYLQGKKGVVEVSVDPTWNETIKFAREAARVFDYGALTTCYISGSHMRHDLVIVPGKDTIAISVDKSSSKDAMIELALSFGG